MTRFALFALSVLTLSLPLPVSAQNAAVSDNGDIRMSGQISTITRDSFVITHDGGSSEVMFNNMSARTVSRLQDANILQNGSHVTVEGKLKDGPFGRGIIEARDIYVQAPTNSAE